MAVADCRHAELLPLTKANQRKESLPWALDVPKCFNTRICFVLVMLQLEFLQLFKVKSLVPLKVVSIFVGFPRLSTPPCIHYSVKISAGV